MKWLIIICTFFLIYGCGEKKYLTDVYDKKIYLENSEDKWTVLSVWADWCNLCVREIPELNMLTNEKNILVLGYNFDSLDKQTLLELKQKLAIDFTLINREPFSIIKKTMPRVIPTIYIISPKGEVVEEITGANNKEMLLQKINKHKK